MKKLKFDWRRLISVRSNFLTARLNLNGTLEKKAPVILIDPGKDEMQVFRKSTAIPGSYSRDLYRFSTLKLISKDPKKHSILPVVPEGGIAYHVKGIEASATVHLTQSQLETLLNFDPDRNE